MEDGNPSDEPGIVWSSTPESVAAGDISILAIAETVFALATYWSLAIILQTTVPLLVSICIVPLLLLRSDKSVALGLKWFRQYVDSGMMSLWSSGASPLRSFRFWCSVLLAVAINVLATYWLSRWMIHPAAEFASRILVIGSGILVGYLGLVFSLIFVTAFCNRELIIVAARKDGALAVTAALVISAGFAVALAGVGPLATVALVIAQIAAAFVAIVYVPTILQKSKSLAAREGMEDANQVTIIRTVLGDVSWRFSFLRYGVYLGGWLRSLVIRFIATGRHPLLGLQALPANWKRTLFVQDIICLPEVVPGYDRDDLLNPAYIWRNRSTILVSTKPWIFFAAINHCTIPVQIVDQIHDLG
jgi:hypothetical protein